MVDWLRNEGRFVDKRSSFVARAAGVDRPAGRAVALSELGYSQSKIARLLDRSESAVDGWLQRVVAFAGPDARWAKRPDEIAVDASIDAATPAEIEQHTDRATERFREAVRAHPDHAPDWAVDEFCGGERR